MIWKKCLIVCSSFLLTAIPGNMIGCGPDVDPYDYFTQFFSASQWEGKQNYRPFYYTGYRTLYSDAEVTVTSDVLLDEWLAYTGKSVKREDAMQFIFGGDPDEMAALKLSIESKIPLAASEDFLQNSFTRFIQKKRDLECLNYIAYAKRAEPFVTGEPQSWQPVQRDAVQMAALINDGLQLHKAAKKNFFKLKYAYQLVRLAHYSGRFEQAITLYDSLVAKNNVRSVLQPMSLALKAGALLRTGNPREAAYAYSRAFAASPVKRISNYISFDWCVSGKDIPMEDYLSLCRNNRERADMLALFGLNTPGNAFSILQQIHALDPASEVLEVLAVREINKLEEKYLTPNLSAIPGGGTFYFSYWFADEGSAAEMKTRREEVSHLAIFYEQLANDRKVKNRGLYANGAAYLHLMLGDFSRAHTLLQHAKSFELNSKQKDQWAMINLLVAINEEPEMNAATEAKILPSLEWLFSKVEEEKKNIVTEDNPTKEWSIFWRNLFAEVLAKKYHSAGNYVKETMCMGVADYASGYSWSGISFMQEKLNAQGVMKLYREYTQSSPAAYDRFLITHNHIRLKDITEHAGVAFLREHDFERAEEWLSKTESGTTRILKDPFKELLFDREHILPGETGSTTRLSFTREMLRLQKSAEGKKSEQKAFSLYKMGLGFYNITYYGYAWELVTYFRSGSDGYYIPPDAGLFKKEYYGAFTAHEYFKQAMEASTDKEFRAKCLFMMAKCSQKQISQPRYDYRLSYSRYQDGMKLYKESFENNRYFPEFTAQYSNTSFFQTAYNSCSYLRDFVKQNPKGK